MCEWTKQLASNIDRFSLFSRQLDQCTAERFPVILRSGKLFTSSDMINLLTYLVLLDPFSVLDSLVQENLLKL